MTEDMRAWTVSEVKAGTLTQCLGIARQFDPEPHSVIVKRKLKSWHIGPLFPHRDLPQARPDLTVSCGSMSTPHVGALLRKIRPRPFAVHLQRPFDQFVSQFDMCFISRHDWKPECDREPRFHRMLGVPHQITAEALTALRAPARERWVRDGQAVTVLVGGPNEAYAYDDETVARLLEAIRQLARDGWTVLVSTSRRSRSEILAELLTVTDPRIKVWDRRGENPYRQFLAAADAFLITKDTVTMHCEALVTGKPVYTFDLARMPGGLQFGKFQWFHDDMQNTLRLTRPFEGSLDAYSYDPPNETLRIGSAVRAALETRHGVDAGQAA
jgi:uncharacterized protein